ncbi:MAG: winged helix-turn-helix transcriptional regulator [Clostridiales bacterium]|nr:winged helix-turn-helix transcriptional regulator [Clostridiales bacterium]
MSKSQKVELYRQAHRLVKKLKSRSIKKMDTLEAMGITPGEFRVLLVLNDKKGISLGAIANGWFMQNSNITTTVKSLVEKDLAGKKKDMLDKRITNVYITEKGEEIRKKITMEFDRKITENLAQINDKKIAVALDAINNILEEL